jgi:hypothetical protein
VITNKHSIVKVISKDNNTPPTEEHIFYQPSILHSDYNKGRYNDIWSVNSFEIGTPKDVILDKKALIDRINNS